MALPERVARIDRIERERRGELPRADRPAYHAYLLLYVGFIAAPIIAGADKFFHLLSSWHAYLAPQVTQLTGLEPHTFMRGAAQAALRSVGRRARDTTADAIGLAIKRAILEAAVSDDPPGYDFEGWLLDRCLAAPEHVSTGAMRAMALEVLREWELATASPSFVDWLDAGAPSDDRAGEAPRRNPRVA